MFVFNYISQHYIMLMELLMLFVLLSISSYFSVRIKRLTRAVGILLLLTSVVFEIEKWTQSFPKLSLLRPTLTACVYSLYPIILILTMLITTEKKLSTDRFLLLLLPEIMSVPVFFTSQWTHLVFWFHDSNKYQSGFFPKWPYLLFAIYCLIFIVMNMIFLKRSSVLDKVIVVIIMIIPIIGMILYIITDYSGDYTGLFTSSLLLYYLFIYIHLARVDALTGLLNRKSFYQDSRLYGSRISAVVSVDMNDLKFINDHFGHDDGDAALVRISTILTESCGKNGTAYRVGGDEFVILYRNVMKDFVEDRIAEMREKLSASSYVCAFGYVMKTEGMTVEEMLNEADEKMYENKALLKGNTR